MRQYPPFKTERGNPQLCDNHRGISLLSIAGTALARVLLNRLNKHLEQLGLLPESQCGLQLQGKCQEQNMDLYVAFVDLTKDLIQSVVRVLENYGEVLLSDQVHSNGEEFHDGMLVRVPNDGEFSYLFPVTNGVKQVCVPAPSLFCMVFSALLTAAFQDGDNGITLMGSLSTSEGCKPNPRYIKRC